MYILHILFPTQQHSKLQTSACLLGAVSGVISPREVFHSAAVQGGQQSYHTVLAVLCWLNGFQGIKCLDSILAVSSGYRVWCVFISFLEKLKKCIDSIGSDALLVGKWDWIKTAMIEVERYLSLGWKCDVSEEVRLEVFYLWLGWYL